MNFEYSAEGVLNYAAVTTVFPMNQSSACQTVLESFEATSR